MNLKKTSLKKTSLKKTLYLTNRQGMHTRPAMRLCELAQHFDAEILLRNESGSEAPASSVIALLMLDSAEGGRIEIEVSGRQQQQAFDAVVSLFQAGFDE